MKWPAPQTYVRSQEQLLIRNHQHRTGGAQRQIAPNVGTEERYMRTTRDTHHQQIMGIELGLCLLDRVPGKLLALDTHPIHSRQVHDRLIDLLSGIGNRIPSNKHWRRHRECMHIQLEGAAHRKSRLKSTQRHAPSNPYPVALNQGGYLAVMSRTTRNQYRLVGIIQRLIQQRMPPPKTTTPTYLLVGNNQTAPLAGWAI